jgi:acetoin:2,6-dichlorophenolindophenol oxidoreductase subunit alpha
MSLAHDRAELLEHFRLLHLIRAFEEALDGLFGQGAITGTSHLCIGQEACAVGASAGLRPDDLVTSNHRGHGHFLARGADPRRVMAELFGKATGYSGGRGGSQHMADFALGFLGSNGITGGMTPIATGAALSQKQLGTGRVVLCFFGDGATGQGAFHEALNMGANWKLPVIYFCENNLYAMSTPVADAFAQPSVAARAGAYALPSSQVDGNDYFAVRAAVQQAADRARAGDGPTLLEALTYRYCGHSKSDACEYRTADEEALWHARDPLASMAARLLDGGLAAADELEALAAGAREAVAEAVEFARQSPEPDPATVADNLFASL